MSRFLCLYWPDFPAWALSSLEPRFAAKPFGIFVSGKAVALSPLVRDAGVRVGWSLSRSKAVLGAQNMALIARPHHLPTTETAWNDLLAQLYRYTPKIESIEPGLLLAQLPSPDSVFSLFREKGASSGWAGDRASAELAARTAPPGTLRRIKDGREESFRHRVPLSIWSESALRADTLQRLGWFGWKTHGDLLTVSSRQLIAQFGEEGRFLDEFVRGNNRRPLATFRPPASVERHFYFPEGAGFPPETHAALELLVAQMWQELGQRQARWLRVRLESCGQWSEAQTLLKPVLGHPEHIEAHWLRQMQTKALGLVETLWPRHEPVETLALELLDLTIPKAESLSLFEAKRAPGVDAALGAELEARFPGRMHRVTEFNPDAYLPEEAFRMAPWTFSIQKERSR